MKSQPKKFAAVKFYSFYLLIIQPDKGYLISRHM